MSLSVRVCLRHRVPLSSRSTTLIATVELFSRGVTSILRQKNGVNEALAGIYPEDVGICVYSSLLGNNQRAKGLER
jgi:hypothetical protein